MGVWINLKRGQLEIPQEKLKSLRKELGNVLTQKKGTCGKLRSILGQVGSCLVAVPFLRILTDQVCKMVDLHTVC